MSYSSAVGFVSLLSFGWLSRFALEAVVVVVVVAVVVFVLALSDLAALFVEVDESLRGVLLVSGGGDGVFVSSCFCAGWSSTPLIVSSSSASAKLTSSLDFSTISKSELSLASMRVEIESVVDASSQLLIFLHALFVRLASVCSFLA